MNVNMKETYKDSDLREALRRKYADTPELPADFMPGLMKRMQETESAPQPAKRRPWLYPAVAAAASILLMIGVGKVLVHTDQQLAPPAPQAEVVAYNQQVKIVAAQPPQEGGVAEQSPQEGVETEQAPHEREVAEQSPQMSVVAAQPPQEIETAAQPPQQEVADVDPNLHYAHHVVTEDTSLSEQDEVPYQDPARVDEFIAKFADNYNVKQGELQCSVHNDSNVVSTVYVFPDVKEVDVFSRLLQVACWYSDETPGYLLNFSHRQFFFELKDLRRQLHYRWIAERVNGKILLYSTCSPIEVVVSSACYLEYRDELMHTRSIKIKTRDI